MISSRAIILSKFYEVSGIVLAPLLAILLTGYMVGEYFLEYSLHSDAAWELTYMKLFSEGIFNSVYSNPDMGAPLSISSDFWPWRQTVLGLFYFIIGLFKGDILGVYKTYYYVLFPICSLAMYLSLRFYFKTSILIALGFGVLYSFIPFMTVHNVHTSVLINSIGIPLLIGLIYHFYNKEFPKVSLKKSLISREVFVGLIIIFFGMSLSVYNTFYTSLFLIFFILKELISSSRNLSRVYVFSLFFLVGILTLFFNIYPHLIFKSNAHFTYDYMTRNFGHSTVYGISIVEFFTPVLDHLISHFRFLSRLYMDNTTIKVNFLSSYLGILGIISFCTAIFYSFKDIQKDDVFGRKVRFLGIFLIVIFLFFYRGGLMTAFYLFTDFMVLGSHYRVAPWVSCISLIVGAIILDRVRINYNLTNGWNNLQNNPVLYFYSRTIFTIFFISLIALSLLDFRGTSAPFAIKPIAGNLATVYHPQKEFYQELNSKIDDDDMILKIPYRCFPETRHANGSYYGDLWSYLMIDKKTRFSWMAFKEGTACVINSQISSMSSNVEEMIKYASYYGYTGVIVNKKGYLDNGAKIINDLNEKLGLEPLVQSRASSYFGEYAYFNIKSENKKHNSIRIEPVEGNPINKILASKTFRDKEVDNITRLFPSPCLIQRKFILNELNKSGVYESKGCDVKNINNKEFFYYSNDKINTYPEVKWSNGEMIIQKDYVGPILSIAVHSTLKKGDYKIKIISNNELGSDSNFYDFNITQWGKSFRKKENFIFSLKQNASAKKLKAIWIHVFKAKVTDSDIKLRAVTIRKVK
ncbi:hypothetical protein HOB96_03960 [bacterium]|nr:hypothetical protein [bacterium]